MRQYALFALSVFTFLNLSATQLVAQGYGGAGGYLGSYDANQYSGNSNGSSPGFADSQLTTESALNVVMVEGTVEVRIKPETLRVVIALTSEGGSAEECQKKIQEQTAAIRQDWLSMQIPEKNIVEDFISVLPRYEWESGKWEEENIRIQKHNGYRMQSNLHLVVKNETEAMQAIDKAFQHGVAEVVTFDYWSPNLTEEKQKAMKAAVEAAKVKSKILLAVFDAPPKVINVQERTKVHFPHELYKTYENVLEEDYLGRYWQERARVKAYRPKMTFYQGMIQQADIIPEPIALHPEISIVSTVRIYYQSPADKKIEEAK